MELILHLRKLWNTQLSITPSKNVHYTNQKAVNAKLLLTAGFTHSHECRWIALKKFMSCESKHWVRYFIFIISMLQYNHPNSDNINFRILPLRYFDWRLQPLRSFVCLFISACNHFSLKTAITKTISESTELPKIVREKWYFLYELLFSCNFLCNRSTQIVPVRRR